MSSPPPDPRPPVTWQLSPANPLIQPPFPSPLIADPTFLFPEASPDGYWHLFAHSLMGIHHFISDDGLRWDRKALAVRDAMRPFIVTATDGYHLLYEKVLHGRFPTQWLPGRRWRSRLEMIHSADLQRWSAADVLLEPSLPWHRAARYGDAVSNPCLVQAGGEYRLYYSAGLRFLPDCGFCEPAAIGLATADRLAGPYRPMPEPLIVPDSSRPFCNLAAGAMKVLAVTDGWAAFQNGIYSDPRTGRSGSAILMLASADGLRWEQAHPEPILQPSSGWMRSHVYALDVRFRSVDGQFYLYFNARDDWHWTRGRERIGLMVGSQR